MKLIRGTTDLRDSHRGGIVTLGSFDGLHRGHQVLLEQTLQWARQLAVPSAMLTFEPMPREFLQAANPPARLTNFRERWRLLEPVGLDALIVLRFNDRLRSLTGEEFVEILTRDLSVQGLVVGHDFRFGKAGQADAAFLAEAGRRHGFEVAVVEPVAAEGERVSSTVIRDALAAGRFDQASVLLGRPYSIRGRVVSGAKLGRQLGFPTANIRVLCRSGAWHYEASDGWCGESRDAPDRRRRGAFAGDLRIRFFGRSLRPRTRDRVCCTRAQRRALRES